MSLEWEIREARVASWNRLIHGQPDSLEELDRLFFPICRECSLEDRVAFILLRTCIQLFSVGSAATRRSLRVALVHWFSNSGPAQSGLSPAASAASASRLDEIMELGLTWREAALALGANPADYSAYQRLLQAIRTEASSQWARVFGTSGAAPFEET